MKPLVAITGATGFLGQHILKAFLEKDYQVRLLVRRDPRLDFGNQPVELVLSTLEEGRALRDFVKGADIIIHAAALVKAAHPSHFDRVNVNGTNRLLDALKMEAPSSRFIHISSMAAREPHLSAYAASKKKSEEIIHNQIKNAISLRPCAIYGPGDRELLDLFKASRYWPVQPMLNGKDARICMVHVSDVAKAVLNVAETLLSSDNLTGIYEVTDNNIAGYSWRNIIETACTTCGGKARPFMLPRALTYILGYLGDSQAKLFNTPKMLTSHKVKEILHEDWSSTTKAQLPRHIWQAEFNLPSGFNDVVNWYRHQGLL